MLQAGIPGRLARLVAIASLRVLRVVWLWLNCTVDANDSLVGSKTAGSSTWGLLCYQGYHSKSDPHHGS